MTKFAAKTLMIPMILGHVLRPLNSVKEKNWTEWTRKFVSFVVNTYEMFTEPFLSKNSVFTELAIGGGVIICSVTWEGTLGL